MVCSIDYLSVILYIFLSTNVANEEAGIAQVANINQFSRDQQLYIPSKRCGDEYLLILKVELSILIGKKSLHLVGLELANFRLQDFNQ